jgi:hypothetical protein
MLICRLLPTTVCLPLMIIQGLVSVCAKCIVHLVLYSVQQLCQWHSGKSNKIGIRMALDEIQQAYECVPSFKFVAIHINTNHDTIAMIVHPHFFCILQRTYPHNVFAIAQDNQQSTIQFFHQTCTAGQVGWHMSHGYT